MSELGRKNNGSIVAIVCSYYLVDELNESVCIMERRAGCHLFASDKGLEDPFCFPA
jgi:hypothetical protein